MANYCGNYGCKNCKYFRHYVSYNYYEPDEYDCVASADDPAFIVNSDEEENEIFERVYGNGEEWNSEDEQICPYYKMIDFNEEY